MSNNVDYRARAAQAEQLNAELRNQLAIRPKHDAFIEQIKDILNLNKDCSYNAIIQKIKTLLTNQSLYKEGAELRKLLNEERASLIKEGKREGLIEAKILIESKLQLK